jgi:aspartate carbamoyltransferase catalytic subunit
MRNPQLNSRGALTHLLTTEGVSRMILTRILDTTELFLATTQDELIKTPLLQGKKVLGLVDQDIADQALADMSMFERAAKSLSADWLGIQTLPSLSKPFLADFYADIDADIGADIIVLRTQASGAPYLIAQHVQPHVHIVNAGDGSHADPTRALMDMYTIRRVKKDFSHLTVVLVGAVLHSRQARSCIHALTTLCVAEVRVVAPLTLLPEGLAQLGVRAYTDLALGLQNADIVIMLDQELNEIDLTCIPSAQEYAKCYGLTEEKLSYAKPDCLILGREAQRIVSEPTGIAVHMAVMSLIAGVSA